MSGTVVPTPAAVQAELAARQACRWYKYYPDEGPLRRALYPKHIAYFNAGATWRQRLFLAANRIGKTDVASFELTCHLTGHYPHWWKGRRFDRPVECWASGDTSGTSRDIIQVALLGPLPVIESRQWSGMIPRQLVYDYSRKQGLPSAIHSIWVRHITGGVSSLDIKSYDQKREAFQGTTKDVIWLDEEPPDEIYGECLIRTMTSNGLVMVTMTPLMGLTPFLAEWLNRSQLEVLHADGTSALTPAHAAVFGETADRIP